MAGMERGSRVYSMWRGGKRENTPNSMPGVDGGDAEGVWALFYVEKRKERKHTKLNAGCGWCECRGGWALFHAKSWKERKHTKLNAGCWWREWRLGVGFIACGEVEREKTHQIQCGVAGGNAERVWALFHVEMGKDRKHTKFNAGCGWREWRGASYLFRCTARERKKNYYNIRVQNKNSFLINSKKYVDLFNNKFFILKRVLYG